MKIVSFSIICACLCFAVPASAQTIPKELWGKWVVRRDLPTTTISCWGESHAKKLLGTELEYSGDAFRWTDVLVHHPIASTKIVTAEQFENDNSAADANGSQVNFRQIGIHAKQAEQITIQHSPANITGGTIEIPGDEVWLKNPKTLIFSVCNVYFEARRVAAPKHATADHRKNP